MEAKDFLTEFLLNTDKNTIWKESGKTYFETYLHDADYTELVNKHIIPSIINKAGMTAQNEYFRIDTVGWKSHYKDVKERAKTVGMTAHLWDLEIAVEHENSKSDWSDEVIKLIHVKCPLKVIIGYSYCDERGEKEQQKLEFISNCMKQIEALKKGKDEEYLIILGNGHNHKTGKSEYKSFGYRGYLYNHYTGAFEFIENENYDTLD